MSSKSAAPHPADAIITILEDSRGPGHVARGLSGTTGMSEATTRTIRYVTADELLVMPEDGLRRELVGGEVRTMTPTGSRHGGIVAELTAVLHHHVMTNSLGQVFGAETGFKLASNPDTVRAPDVTFVRRARIPPGDLPEQFWPGPPDLAPVFHL